MARKTQDRAQSTSATLPEFDAPPLFETVFGVRFPTLKGWDVRHFRPFLGSSPCRLSQVRSQATRFKAQDPTGGWVPRASLCNSSPNHSCVAGT